MRQTFKRERNSVISVMREAAKAQTGAGRSGLESTPPLPPPLPGGATSAGLLSSCLSVSLSICKRRTAHGKRTALRSYGGDGSQRGVSLGPCLAQGRCFVHLSTEVRRGGACPVSRD